MAAKRLSIANKLLTSNDDKKFYEEIFKALYGFFKDKFNLKTSEINKERIRETLSKHGIEVAIIDRTENLLNQCEMARFAPMSDVSHEQVYQEAIALLSAIQKGIK